MAGSPEIAVAYVSIVPEVQGFARELRQQVVGPAEDAGGDAGAAAGGSFRDRLKEGLKGGAAAAGVLAATALFAGFKEAFEQKHVAHVLQAQLGTTDAVAKAHGAVAGDLYTNGIVDSFQEGADAIKSVVQSGLAPPDATNKQLQSIATKAQDVATVFDQDLGGVTNAVSQMMRTGLADSASEAFDIITKGFQSGANKADDLLDTFNEYGTQFRKVGLSGADAMGLMNQAIRAGARDSDIAADAIKEFSIRAIDGSKTTADGFKQLGLNASDMAAKISAGGDTARKALDQTLDKLRAIKDPTKRAAIATELFGTQAEDLGDALYAMDPSSAADKLGKFAGATKKLGDDIRSGPMHTIEVFKRKLTQSLVNFLGNTVIPGVKDAVDRLKGIWDESGKDAKSLPDHIIKAFKLLGKKLWNKLVDLLPDLIEGLKELGSKLAKYITEHPKQALKLVLIAAAIVVGLMLLPALIAAALVVVANLILYGFVKKLIESTKKNLPKWWASFKKWLKNKAKDAGDALSALGTAIKQWFLGLWRKYISGPVSRAWNSFIRTVKGLPDRAVSALKRLGTKIAGVAKRAWDHFKRATSRKVRGLIGYVKDVPDKILNGLGNLGSLLYDAGTDVVRGLWNGIKSMGRWLANTLTSWARDIIPGPIADALGIHSPSRVMADEVGRWIPAGVVVGIEKGSGAVDTAMRRLVAPPAAPRLSTVGAVRVPYTKNGVDIDPTGWVQRGAAMTAHAPSMALAAPSAVDAQGSVQRGIRPGDRIVLSVDGRREFDAYLDDHLDGSLIDPADRGRKFHFG